MQFSTPELIRERQDAYRRQMQSVNPPNPGYTMNNTIWPGLAKVVEEAGEITQVAGKIMACFGQDTYYGGEDLRGHLQEEAADLIASLTYLIEENKLDKKAISKRVRKKLAKYYQWKESNE